MRQKTFRNIFCTLPKAISYGNCRMKIQHNIRVKRSKLFLIGGRNPLPNFSIANFVITRYSNFCPRDELPSPNFSMVNFVTNPLFQFLPKGWIPRPSQFFNVKSCFYPAILISTLKLGGSVYKRTFSPIFGCYRNLPWIVSLCLNLYLGIVYFF